MPQTPPIRKPLTPVDRESDDEIYALKRERFEIIKCNFANPRPHAPRGDEGIRGTRRLASRSLTRDAPRAHRCPARPGCDRGPNRLE